MSQEYESELTATREQAAAAVAGVTDDADDAAAKTVATEASALSRRRS